ncbi:uncharacterized protein BJ171DRAFT_489295 [Polychytrium aggregatum]|uniref:uncharacterized protein n=1 Tax=Polychytrium aggregatum TaxID=110093 RepID=UPI0022FE46A3|nr:uncharacterized protein BJ171DRAFT_489295 [Polychytrium aggregatum]KAI9208544.1 hypothetical protein BJ171DRAFT_489295 [Polychytrium aggregatum]
MLRSYARLGEFASNPADFGAIVSIIEPLKQMIVDLDFDEYLGELSETLKLELDILQSLCRAQDALYDMDFKSSTLDMYAARTSLARWMDKLGLQASSNSKEHRVLMWLSVFASATRWKFDCYFYRLLKSSDSLTSKSATSIEDKHVEALSFRSILSSQCLNLPLSNLSFIYVIPAGGSYFKDGYTCRGRDSYEQLRGIQSFPAILSYPEDTPPMSHWPNIIGVFQDHFELRYLEGQSRPILVQRTVQQRPMLGSNFAKLASRSQLASSGLVQFYDEAVDVTYCMHKMDRFLAAVIIYQGRVSNTDVMARTLALFTLLAEKLQLTDVLRVLK